jgi:hypothetical protein
MQVRVPLEEIAGGCDRDYDPRPAVHSERSAQVLDQGFRAALGEITQQLAALAEDPAQQPWHGEHDR